MISSAIHLDSRLSCAAALVRQGSRLADVGTDHALLPAALVEGGVCPSAIASDIRPGPAERARMTVESTGLSGRIQVRLGGGLSVLSPGEADDIVIAGMGGENIASILEEDPWVKNERYHLILQPMSRPEILRRFLRENGFSLLREPAVRDGKRLYTVLLAVYDPAASVPGAPGEDVRDYVGKVDPSDREGAAYLKRQAGRLLKQAAGLEQSERMAGREQAVRLRELAAAILSYMGGDADRR